MVLGFRRIDRLVLGEISQNGTEMRYRRVLKDYAVLWESLLRISDATVFHSNNYSSLQEFSRYFDTGAFHAENPWLLEQFGRPLGEGRRFVASELGYLWENAPSSIPRAMLVNGSKYLGYTLGTRFRDLPATWPARLGMNKTYWKNWHEKQVGSSCG